MKQNAICPEHSLTMSVLVIIFSATLLAFAGTTVAQGQQQRFFSPSSNNGNFALPRVQFQEDNNSADLNFPQRRLSSADPLPLTNPSSSSFFSSQQQLPTGTFTNSGPFSRPPNVQPFILNGQQTQFQPLRNSGSLSFVDAVSPPSFFQQAPQRPLPPPQQQQQPQTQQQFNFFPSNSQQQRFRPALQQQRTEQPDSTDNFDEHQNAQSTLILQQPRSQESFNSSPRRPLSQTNGVIPVSRNPPPTGSIRWWNPTTADAESVAVSDDDTADGINTNDDTVELVHQRQNQPPKRGRGQPQLAKRRPITTPEPSSTINLEEHQEPAAIGFTVIHDENDDRSSWSQPIITTHRPQPGPTAFRNRNQPAVVSGSVINRRPTTFSPLSVASSSTTIRSAPQQPSALSGTVNRQQPTTVRSRKSSLFSTTTTTMNTLDYEQEEEDEEEQTVEEKRQFQPRKSTTTQPPPVPITTLRTALRPRINSLTTLIPQQQQRMKKIVNNPAIIQSITTRKPTTTSTTTLAPTTTTEHQIVDEYEEYEDIEHTTTSYTTTELPLNKKHSKFPLVNQSSTVTINQKNNNSLIATTESWVVVASVQTSRSVSSSSSMVGGGTNRNNSVQESTTLTAPTPTTKHRFNNKPVITTTSTTTVESIIDKLDRVQSELSNGILYGSSSNTNNGSRILTDMQSSGNNDDKRNDVIISSFTTPATEKTTKALTSTVIPTTTSTTITSPSTTMSTSTTVSSSTTSVPSTTNYISTTTQSEKEEEDENEDKEDEEKEKEEEESDDSDKETTFVRKFVPSKQRTSTVSSITSTSTVKPTIQVGKKKSLIDSVKFDDLLSSGLLPAGFNPKPPPAYKSKTISTTTTTEIPSPVTNNISSPQPKNSSSSSISTNTTPSTTTTKAKSSGLNIKFVDDSSALASLLPPGFKLEDAIKPVEILSPSLLPPGFKLPTENVETSNKNKEQESIPTTVVPTTDVPLTTSTTTITSSTSGIVFPNSGKGTNSSGTRKPLPSSKKMQAAVTLAPTIQKGWPVRVATEFTGWSTPSTTPLSIEKLLQQSKAAELAAMTSTLEPTTSTTTTTTTTTTTMKPPPTTTPGQCSESDSVCELVGTVRIVGSGSEKWVPELLDHNTAEWRLLASEIETQLDKVYSKSPALSKWYKTITIDSFSPGSNEISNGKPDKNAGVLVDFFVQLNQLGRTVSTADIRRLFHETLQKEGNLGSSAQPLQYGNGGDYEGLYLKLGRFTVDPARTDFIVLPKPTRTVTATAGTDDAWLPQWAVAVMVIGLASLLFVLIFGITVLVSRNKNNKKVPPPTLQASMISDDQNQHIYGTGKNGPTTGSRHMMHHPQSHSNSNYNISSYGYDNYAIDDDMMMLDEDDLEDVDRLYDMDAVWSDHDHEKVKVPPNIAGKKHRDTQHGGHYDSWRSTALAPQTLTPVQTGYYTGGSGYGYGTDPSGYGAERRHYHREATSTSNPRSHHHYPSSHHNPNTSYTTGPRKPPQQYHPDYDTDF
ncbi:flocculation protein FLO11 [Acyrthosiphon pisum]|uniref:SEA domain-containing protein n=1 Tax=Acyrthosiphon pisum TaxID=7029 RepID=A0A8R1W939_ACYPI|nr:flocculation protein FLO11 [Acyrthosiphon pisum]XP_016657626.1 flocculation protein FLO11 [Acyrthosiphon pisum]|eukprot:XP_001952621.2 PREDICTED: flocculation protein FLO11 [Acyrthosiphon pisum]